MDHINTIDVKEIHFMLRYFYDSEKNDSHIPAYSQFY